MMTTFYNIKQAKKELQKYFTPEETDLIIDTIKKFYCIIELPTIHLRIEWDKLYRKILISKI